MAVVDFFFRPNVGFFIIETFSESVFYCITPHYSTLLPLAMAVAVCHGSAEPEPGKWFVVVVVVVVVVVAAAVVAASRSALCGVISVMVG